ncbi:MAG: glycosyltransferase, partial [Planctomycetota bacterium]
VGVARSLKAALHVPVLCTLSGEDIFLDELPEPYRQEAFDLIRERSRDANGFVATTEYFADHAAAHFALPRDRVHVVPLGVHVEDFAEPAEPPSSPFTIGYLARICPAKGLAGLCEALVRLRKDGRDCRVRAAGYLGAEDRPYLNGIRDYLDQHHAGHAFEYLGEVSRTEKIDFLRSLHLFSVPTVYHEAKGVYIIESLAAGVPVVQPRHGSFPELVEATGGGLLYDPTGPEALATTIARLMDDAALRRRLADQGRQAVQKCFTDVVMADQTWALFESYAAKTRVCFVMPTPVWSAPRTELRADSICKSFPTCSRELVILRDITLTLSAGESAAIMGPSGSGKSTLLNNLGTLEPPSSGRVTLDGVNPFELPERDLARFRNRRVGFIFQEHHLLPQCTVL